MCLHLELKNQIKKTKLLTKNISGIQTPKHQTSSLKFLQPFLRFEQPFLRFEQPSLNLYTTFYPLSMFCTVDRCDRGQCQDESGFSLPVRAFSSSSLCNISKLAVISKRYHCI